MFQDIPSAGLQLILDAIYKGSVELFEGNICDAIAASHHIQYTPLLGACEKYLLDTMNPQKCMTYRTLALNHDMGKVADSIDKFILKEFSEVCLTESFLRLTQGELCRYLEKDELIAEEGEVFEAIRRWIVHNKADDDQKRELARLLRWGLIKLINPDQMNAVLDTLPCLEEAVDGCRDPKKGPVNQLLKTLHPHCRPRGEKTYAMLLRGRSNPYLYWNNGQRDKLAFLREEQIGDKTEFVGWHAPPPRPFLDSSVHSFVINDLWFLFGVDNDYEYSFMCFDGRSSKWLECSSPKADLAVGTYGFLVGTKIVVGGGKFVSAEANQKGQRPEIVDQVSVFDLTTGSWEEMSPEHPGLLFAATCAFQGQGYVIGGQRYFDESASEEELEPADPPLEGYAFSKSVHSYNPDEGAFVTRTPLHLARYHASAGAVGDYILVVGGLVHSKQPDYACEVYSPRSNQWTFATGDTNISDGLVVPTTSGFAILKGESFPLQYFDVDSEGKVTTYKKLSEPAVKWMPGKDHWAYIEGNVMTLAVLTMLPNKSTSWNYKVKETSITLVKRY